MTHADRSSASHGETLVEERLHLSKVLRHQAGSGRRRSRPASIARPLRLAADLRQNPFEIGLDKGPAAHIFRLFLAPEDFGLLEARELAHQGLERERIELLDAQQIHIIRAALLAILVKVVIDLA